MFDNPNPRFSGGLAQLLMPPRNFAQERADRAAELQLKQMNAQQQQMMADEKRLAQASIDNTLSQIDAADLLDEDKARLNGNITEPFRLQMQDELRNKYGGDANRFDRERGRYYEKKIARSMMRSPDYQQAMRNMANNKLYEDAKKKGLLVAGDYEQAMLDFRQGRTNVLPDVNAYKAPENVWDYFNKNYHEKGKFGQLVAKKGGREVYQAFEVTPQDVFNQLINQGLSPTQAQDYLNRLNYKGGRGWKMESEAPWERQQRLDTSARQREQLNQGWAQIGIQQQRADADTAMIGLEKEYKQSQIDKNNADAAKKMGEIGAGQSLIQAMFDPDRTKLRPVRASGNPKTVLKTRDGQPILFGPGVGGASAEALARNAGLAGAVVRQEGEGYNTGDLLGIPSRLTSVNDRNGKTFQSATGQPIQFESIDTNHLIYLPTTGPDAPPNGLLPHIRAYIRLDEDGKATHKVGADAEAKKYVRKEVLLPISYSELNRRDLVNELGRIDTDGKRGEYAPPVELMPPSSMPTMFDKFLPSNR